MPDQGDNPWRVALCISRELGCKERLISGACRAAREAGDWDMLHVPPEPGFARTLEWFKPQGVLFHGMRPFLPPAFQHDCLWVGVNDDSFWVHDFLCMSLRGRSFPCPKQSPLII